MSSRLVAATPFWYIICAAASMMAARVRRPCAVAGSLAALGGDDLPTIPDNISCGPGVPEPRYRIVAARRRKSDDDRRERGHHRVLADQLVRAPIREQRQQRDDGRRLRKQSQHQDRSERYLQHRYRDAEKARPCAKHIVREDGEVLRHTRIGLRAVGDEQNVRASEMRAVLEDSLVQPQHAQHHPCRAKGDRRGTSDPSCVSSHINAAAPKASLALSQLIMTVSYIDASVSLSVNV